MDYFHGIEEQLPKPDYKQIYQQALKDKENERNEAIKQSIKNKLDELKRIDEELKMLEKKRKKLNAMLLGYSQGQVEQVQEETQQ